jgi:hypothetical protein
MVQVTLRRASRAFGTVYSRMRTCGRPAVPSISASDSEMRSSLETVFTPYSRPGLSTAVPDRLDAAAWCSKAGRLNPARDSNQMVVTTVPAARIVALTICTQVVPFMPPTST